MTPIKVVEPIVLERVFSGQIAVGFSPWLLRCQSEFSMRENIYFRAPKINPRQNAKLILLRDV